MMTERDDPLIDVRCPSCGKLHRAEERLAGSQARCKGCGGYLSIPGEQPIGNLATAGLVTVPPVKDRRRRSSLLGWLLAIALPLAALGVGYFLFRPYLAEDPLANLEG